MKLPNLYLPLIFAWLVMSSATAQASFFDCPTGAVCAYAGTVSIPNPDHVTALTTDGDITGGAFDNEHSGLKLAASGSGPSEMSIIIAELTAPIYQSLWIVTDEPITPIEPDEQMRILISTDNGINYESLGMNPFLNYNANDTAAIIDLTGILDFDSDLVRIDNPVTHVQIQGLDPVTDLGCYFADFSNSACTTFSNEMEVLGIAGIQAEVSSVPVPAALWLFGSGLLGLVATGRYRKK